MLGREGEALLIDFQSMDREPVGWRPEDTGLGLLVIDTRVSHAHESGGYGDRRRECEAAADRLGVRSLREVTDPAPADPRVRHVVSEIRRVRETVAALAAGDWAEVGRLFTESHVSLRDDFEVSCAELDLAVSSAIGTGALGARMTGGGFGGSAIALVREDDLDRIAGEVAAGFAAAGFKAPQFLIARASAGATLIS
jgi:galactokinase